MASLAERLTEAVPEARRADWKRLASKLAEPDAKQKQRVEALVRACALFAGPPRPLDPRAGVEALPGLGEAARAALGEHRIENVFDVAWTLPWGYDDLTSPVSVEEAIDGAAEAADSGTLPPRVPVHGMVKSGSLVRATGRPFVNVVLASATPGVSKTLALSWFFAAHGILSVAQPKVACIAVGRVRFDDKGRARMAHPDLLRDDDASRVVRARYPRPGVPEGTLRRAAASAASRIAEPYDPVPPAIVAREGMPEARELLASIHALPPHDRTVPGEPVRRAAIERLAYVEAFTFAFQRQGAEGRGGDAPALRRDRAVEARLRAELGFRLTPGQERAAEEIARDLEETAPMRRLLLGDVGTGKTAVALCAAAQCVASGYQAAILAPTGVLAEQYMDAVGPLARATGAAVVLVTGQGDKALAPLLSGAVQVAIGTHALLSEGVRFARLGLVIVDEQHRLGVAQRVALVRKGGRPHLLTLSATPIPRTLALALRGELKTSILTDRPRGRLPPETVVRPAPELPAVVEELRAALARGERAFVICPRIEESDDDAGDDAPLGAVAQAKVLGQALAPAKVALVHGGLRAEAQRKAMSAFRKGEAGVLVATTVVEVGVDVPEATQMVVLGAERFGLAQLHQLRGRVGRGELRGRCTLLHGPVDALATRRLRALGELTTGEEVARADLALRGAGDLAGTRQHGEEEALLYVDPASPPAWLPRVEGDARQIRASDPRLEAPEHAGLALAMRRFARALAVRDEAG